MPLPKKTKFTPISQEEEDSDIEAEDLSQYKSRSSYRHWLYFGIFSLIAILAVWIASITVLAEYGKNAGKKSTLGLDQRYVDLLIESSKEGGCSNGLTANPVVVCSRECEKEFCVNDFAPKDGEQCRGLCFPTENSTFEKCNAACVCCEALVQCLIDNNNNKDKCYTDLKEDCAQDGVMPNTEFYINPICGPIQSLDYCKDAGVGFNSLIEC